MGTWTGASPSKTLPHSACLKTRLRAGWGMSLPLRTRTVIADDDPDFVAFTTQALADHNLGPVASIASGSLLQGYLQEHACSLVIFDYGLVADGLHMISEINAAHPQTAVIVCTGYHDITTAVQCLQHGANDYLVKPVSRERLADAVGRALGKTRAPAATRMPSPLGQPSAAEAEAAFGAFLTADPVLRQSITYLQSLARVGVPVLLSGATGTGKRLLARSIHALSRRKGHLVEIDAHGLDATQLASALFGASGRTSGAAEHGAVLRASAGSLVIHDADSLPSAVQVSLARLIQSKCYYPSDSHLAKASSARIIVTSSASWPQLEATRSFRRDLLYALRAHHVHIPPLRERPADLRLLAYHLVVETAAELGRIPPPVVTDEVLAVMARYSFPGNVRELRSLIADACVLSSEAVLALTPFQAAIQHEQRSTDGVAITYGSHLPSLSQARNHLVTEALRATKGNQARAASILGISRQAISQLILKRRWKQPSSP